MAEHCVHSHNVCCRLQLEVYNKVFYNASYSTGVNAFNNKNLDLNTVNNTKKDN